MGRAERRRNAKNEKKERKTTYNLTREQLNNLSLIHISEPTRP